ncbi:MAG TPA: tetratricopeptide repeat protein [Alphaproteobacteria bacterium]|nr:tetratricopeptide repeat protein [Alphaproteobacteria bacterium]
MTTKSISVRLSVFSIRVRTAFALLLVVCVISPAAWALDWNEYARACRENGGVPSPNPARCDFPRQSAQPSGPTPEQRREQADEADLQEAALDANDKGVAAYKRGDYAAAIKYFQEALSYEPDYDVAQINLRKSQEKMRESEAARQAKSVAQSGAQAAATTEEPSKAKSNAGFDTSGQDVGGIPVPVGAAAPQSGDPVVPPAKRTPQIAALEKQRGEQRTQMAAIDTKIKTLDPQKDSVQIAKLKQQKSEAQNKVNYLNFSINEELAKPAPKTGQAASGKS